MLIETAMKNYEKAKEQYEAAARNEDFGSILNVAENAKNNALLVLIASIIMTFVILPLAIFFVLDCGTTKKWKKYIQTLVIFSFFVPYIGFWTMSAMVVYGTLCYYRKV